MRVYEWDRYIWGSIAPDVWAASLPYLRMYPRRTPLCSVSGGGCHCTMMDWLVLPLATMFFGGALGGSSGSISLEKKRLSETLVSPEVPTALILSWGCGALRDTENTVIGGPDMNLF